ncbi:shikimate kinase [Bacillus alveayuensis]|uniref:shikimate kinase n=1 Tax=Aeribacillus alveayuensis TaxID=279215 RepID=UPI0005CCDE3A|nr:shikimate kinase [Bacillus alveayuensis]
MKVIFLTGFMGAGKTSVGRQLAERLGVSVVDTDELIEQKVGKSINEIFAEEGEAVFRKYERELLQTLPLENIVITTGGGMVIQKENRDWMKKHGIVIYLHCEPEEILRRLASDETRPLLQQRNKQEQIKRLLTERLPYYEEAHFMINTTNKTIAEIVDEIVTMLKQHK